MACSAAPPRIIVQRMLGSALALGVFRASVPRITSVRSGSARGRRQYPIRCLSKIPALIVYGTATVNEENQIRFFDDIYGYDAELEKALNAGYPYAW